MSELSPYLVGDYAPIEQEVAADGLSVTGELPADLVGSYVRNGPNAKLDPKGRYHWFDGDGMLHALRFDGGKASYRNRWVRTAGLAADEQAGAAQWSGLMETTRDNPKGAPYKDTANTDVSYHNGSLMCLWYICGVPYRVDANTLETIGPDTFGRDKPMLVSAHNKVDERTGEMMFFNYGPRPPFMQYGVLGADGALKHLTDVALPGPRLPHDMAVSENYSILMDLPVFFRPEAIKQKRWLVDFHRDMPSRFGILPRHGDGDTVKWFEAEPCYIYHTINAWEEGSEVVMVGCRVRDPIPAMDPSHGQWARMIANLTITAELYEWRFDLETGATKERVLDDRNTEFPAMNNGMLGQKTRYSYNVALANDPTMRFTALVKYDTDTGAADSYELGPGRSGSEAVFAPRPNATGEDDGYVISFVHDGPADRSDVLVFDAQHISRGPVATIALPQRVPLGFHACWVPGGAQ